MRRYELTFDPSGLDCKVLAQPGELRIGAVIPASFPGGQPVNAVVRRVLRSTREGVTWQVSPTHTYHEQPKVVAEKPLVEFTYGGPEFMKKYVSAIYGAKRIIRISTYGFSDHMELMPVKAALRLGTPARILVGLPEVGAGGDLWLLRAISPHIQLKVQRKGERFCHAKMLIVDDELAFIGSQNLTYSGMIRNFEAGVIVRDPKVVAQAIQHFDKEWYA